MNWRVVYFFIILLNFKIGKNSIAFVGVRHDFSSSVDVAFFKKLLKNIPNWLHEIEIHSLIVVFEVNPSTIPVYNILPLLRIFHNNTFTLLIVLFDSHFLNLLFVCNVPLLINFVLHRKSVAIPPESSRNEMACLGSVAADDVLDSSSSNVSVMGCPSRERRSIIESVWWQIFSLFKLEFESLNLFPIL